MEGIEYPFIEPLPTPLPVYMHLNEINDWASFFVYMDAAIRCHPFVLVAAFLAGLFIIYIIANAEKVYHYIASHYPIHSYKGGD
jgi:hypothetical protein